MERVDELAREVATLRARMSRVSAAMLRIGATLDLGTILREAVESACALTGAGYGAITVLDEAGQPGDLVAFGLTETERREMSELPDGRRLLEYFRDLPRPLRVADGSVDMRSLGLSSVLLPSKTLLGTPLRHRGAYVGKFCLFEKEGGKAFSDEDEEVLVLFASQAAAAIANAGMHKAERQARADLEALVETSPVGVAVWHKTTTFYDCFMSWGAPFFSPVEQWIQGLGTHVKRVPGKSCEAIKDTAGALWWNSGN